MAATDTPRRSPAVRALKGLVLTLAATTTFAFAVSEQHAGPPQPAMADGHARAATAATRAAAPLPASRPLRVTVPAIRVDAPLMDLGLEDSGRLAAPPEIDKNLAGWWAGGPAPGAQGTAVIAGHVDVPNGPAVFYDLGALTPGMKIGISREDGTKARFIVDGVDVYDADNFPDDKVYADTGRPELRLITCGGGFDKQRQQYEGNVVIAAHLVG
ncbi:class F sortase [Streptomyces rectiviolaceus]|uniref:class F sortase n=1 Tax=Streptomyces rectiviolaceus TaxID=332591 RepID=UPI0031D89FC2